MPQDAPTFRYPEFPGAWVLGLPGPMYWQQPCYQDIYGLVDPRTNMVRYIGRSRNAQLRLREHLRPGHRKDASAGDAKVAWLDELAGLGLEPTISILETIEPIEPTDGYYAKIRESNTFLSNGSGELTGVRTYDREMRRHQIYVNEREQRWIFYGVQNYWPLTNAEAQIREDGNFTEAFRDALRQNRALDILHEPLESPAWSALVPTCPHSVFEARRQKQRSKRRKAHQAAGQNTRPRRDDHQAPVM